MRTDQQLLSGIWFHTYISAHELQVLVYSEQTVMSHMSPSLYNSGWHHNIPNKHSEGKQGYFDGITPSLTPQNGSSMVSASAVTSSMAPPLYL